MKNALIAVRDVCTVPDGTTYEPVAAALLRGGFAQDKVFLLDERDGREFAQTLIEGKNFFDNVFIVVPQASVPAYTAQAAELLKISPAAAMEAADKNFFVLPFGGEGALAVSAEVLPRLAVKFSVRRDTSVLRFVGAPRERVEAVLAEAEKQSEGAFTVRFTEKYGDGRVELSCDGQTPKGIADDVLRACVAGLDAYLYALEDTPLHERVVELLKLRGKKLCVAESFTGGGVTKRIVDVPGASAVLQEGIVAYANEAKVRRLNVRQETLAKHGAVSDDTAYEMAAHLIASGACDLSLATTGIAGPSSDGTNKPVGLCYLAVGTAESVYVYKYLFSGSREEITERAINQALFLLYKNIR